MTANELRTHVENYKETVKQVAFKSAMLKVRMAAENEDPHKDLLLSPEIAEIFKTKGYKVLEGDDQRASGKRTYRISWAE